MTYKFDLEDFDKRLIEKLSRQGKAPVGGSLIARLREEARKRRLPKPPTRSISSGI